MQPLIPPFPVLRKRPDQFLGNHASMLISERFDVGMRRATRQISAEMIWYGRVQVTLLSGNVRLVPAATAWVNHTVPLPTFKVLAKSAHCWLKLPLV